MAKIRLDVNSENIDRFLWIWLVLLAALMPLLFSTSANSQFYLKLVVACWMLFIFYAVWAVRFFILPRGEFISGLLPVFLAALTLLVIISTSFSLHRFTSLWGKYGRFEGLFAMLLYLAVFLAAANLKWDKSRLFFLVKALSVIAGVISLYALVQSAGHDFISWRVLKFETGRAYANFGNPVLLGSYLAMMLPLALVLTFLEKQKTKRWLWLGLDILIFGGLIASISRGAWLAAVIGYVAITWTALRRKLVSWQRLALISSIFLISIITIGLLIIGKGKSGNILVNKIVSVTQPDRGTIHSRIEIWKGAVKVVGSRPFLGYGPDNFPWVYPRYQTFEAAAINGHSWRTDNAHNWLLQLAATLGLPATIIFTSIIFWIFYFGLQLISKPDNDEIAPLIAAVGLSLAVYFISLLTAISTFGNTIIFWLLMGIMAFFISKRYQVTSRILRNIFGGFVSTASLLLFFLALTFSRNYFADLRFFQGVKYHNAGYSDIAVSNFDQAVQLSPDQPYYYQKIGQIFLRLFQKSGNDNFLNMAFENLLKAKKLNPYDIQNYLSLAQAYNLAGNFRDNSLQVKAKEALESAKMIAPKSAKILFRLGEIDFRLGNLETAEQNLKQSIEVYPDEAAVYVVLGSLYERKNLVKKARKSYSRAIKINPDDVSAMDARIRLKRLNE